MNNKMVDIDLTSYGADCIMNALSVARELLEEASMFGTFDEWSFKSGYYKGLLRMLQLLDIEPVFNGSECIGLLASPEEVAE